MRHHPVIAFVVPYPFEILDLTGPVSVFERAALHGERYYSIRILSTRSSGMSKQKGEWSLPTPANTLTMWDRSTPSL